MFLLNSKMAFIVYYGARQGAVLISTVHVMPMQFSRHKDYNWECTSTRIGIGFDTVLMSLYASSS